jgi:hypothetical protein
MTESTGRTALAIALASLIVALAPAKNEFGHFIGTVKAEWLDDGRKMRLLEPFVYQDQNSVQWLAPKESVVDGASIPKVFWSFIGGPFEGRYRNASVTHDVECKIKQHQWRDVHRMFYNASRCGGVGALKAKIMFGAVYHFGPRWSLPRKAEARSSSGKIVPASFQAGAPRGPIDPEPTTRFESDEDYFRMKVYIQKHPDVDLQTIEGFTAEFLRKEMPEARRPELRLNAELRD